MRIKIENLGIAAQYFRDWISQPGVLADYLRHYLPPQVAAQIDPESAEIVPDTFIDEQLRPQLPDLLCRVNLRQRGAVFIYCLIEHKSYPAPWVAFQLLRYMAQIWQQELKAGGTQLRPIVPLVLYHGEQNWHVPPNFRLCLASWGRKLALCPNLSS